MMKEAMMMANSSLDSGVGDFYCTIIVRFISMLMPKQMMTMITTRILMMFLDRLGYMMDA